MFNIIILLALGYFSYYYGSSLVKRYAEVGFSGFNKTDYFMILLVLGMVALFVVYLIRTIKWFRNKDEREAQKLEYERKLEEQRAEQRRKRLAQYREDYDDEPEESELTEQSVLEEALEEQESEAAEAEQLSEQEAEQLNGETEAADIPAEAEETADIPAKAEETAEAAEEPSGSRE